MADSTNKLEISELTVQDLPGIAALQPHDWQNILPNTRFYIASKQCYAVKATIDGRIAGTGAAILHDNVVWLANIITHPDLRNKGTGTAITIMLTEWALKKCDTVLLISTPYGKPIYNKLGFVAENDYLFFSGGKIIGSISPYIIPCTDADKETVLTMDEKATGEKRSWILIPHLAHSWLYKKNGTIQGYFIPSLGEGLIIADTQEAGIALMQLSLLEERKPVIPADNHAAVDFLLQHGFLKSPRIGTRMYMGKKVTYFPQKKFARIGGNMG